MPQGSFNPKIMFLGQKVWPVTHTHRHTWPLWASGFQEFFLQPVFKDRSNIVHTSQKMVLLFDNMFDYIARLLGCAVEGVSDVS